MEIFVGNLPITMLEEQLRLLFQPYGQVSAARVIVDKFSGVSRGFGFVTMPDEREAAAAIGAVNGSLVQENRLRAEASQFRPRVEWKGGAQR